MKATRAKTAGEDGWYSVSLDGATIGHVKKVDSKWRARRGKTEWLGFRTAKSATLKLELLAA